MSIESYRRQRSQLKGRLTNIRNFITKVGKDVDRVAPEKIAARLQAVEDIHSKFQGISQQLVTLVVEEEDLRRDAAEEGEFDERYFTMRAALVQLLERLKPSAAPSAGPSTAVGGSVGDAAVMQVLE